MDLRKKDYEDEMDGGCNWLKMVTVRGFDVNVVFYQRVFG
jgi:hypothetical protein